MAAPLEMLCAEHKGCTLKATMLQLLNKWNNIFLGGWGPVSLLYCQTSFMSYTVSLAEVKDKYLRKLNFRSRHVCKIGTCNFHTLLVYLNIRNVLHFSRITCSSFWIMLEVSLGISPHFLRTSVTFDLFLIPELRKLLLIVSNFCLHSTDNILTRFRNFLVLFLSQLLIWARFVNIRDGMCYYMLWNLMFWQVFASVFRELAVFVYKTFLLNCATMQTSNVTENNYWSQRVLCFVFILLWMFVLLKSLTFVSIYILLILRKIMSHQSLLLDRKSTQWRI
jgi:hypothetical protein